MLSYALAIAIAFCSLILFSTAFVMSDAHRQDDFLWSGVGLFYALVLWYCAPNLKGAVLLGQTAACVLIVSYSWQTLKLRKALANPAQAQEISKFSLLKNLSGLLNRQKTEQPASKSVKSTESKVTSNKIAIPETPAQTDQPEKTKSSSKQNSSAPETQADEKTNSQPNAELETTSQAIAEPAIVNPEMESSSAKPTQATVSIAEEPISPRPEASGEDTPSTLAPETADSENDFVEASLEQSTPSQLENLEEVEVAEVLEAIPEEAASQKNVDQNNIIEVATSDFKDINPEQQKPHE